MKNEDIALRVQAYVAKYESDLFLFRAPIYRDEANRFIDLVSKTERRPNAVVFLTTDGGDPNSAFRMARCVRIKYKKIRLLVAGPCKSAGTLFALGADEIAFSECGELGPLDIQITKPDEILIMGSGLEVFTSLTIVENHTWDAFREYFIRLVKFGLSTKAASDIAAKLTSAVIAPLSAQIDPLRVAEAQRAIDITKHYGRILETPNLKGPDKDDMLDRLVRRYPSHAFVIDAEEAKNYFKKIDQLSKEEQELADAFSWALRKSASGPKEAFITDLGEEYRSEVHVESEISGGGVEDLARGARAGTTATGPVISEPPPRATAATPARSDGPKPAAPAGRDGH